jgi:rhodanese-related sulfurtransferase
MNRPAAIPALDPLYADIRRRDPVRPAVLLDVREPREVAQVRIEGTLRIPMSEIGARIDEVPRDRPVIVMCAMGARSANVAGHLLGQGWEDVGNLAGGIEGWERLGLPVRRGPVAPDEA